MAWQVLRRATYDNGVWEWDPSDALVSAAKNALENHQYSTTVITGGVGSYPRGFYIDMDTPPYLNWPNTTSHQSGYDVVSYRLAVNSEDIELPEVTYNGLTTKAYLYKKQSEVIVHRNFNTSRYKGLGEAIYNTSVLYHYDGYGFSYDTIFGVSSANVSGYESEYDPDDGKYRIYYPTPQGCFGLFFLYDDDTEECVYCSFNLTSRAGDNGEYYITIASSDKDTRYDIVVRGHATPPVEPEDWESIPSLDGPETTAQLTMIKKESINNGLPVTNGSIADLSRVLINSGETPAAISSLLRSTPANTYLEKVIMSGDNYLNIEVLSHTDPYDFTARLDYFLSDGTLIYSHTYTRESPEDLTLAAIRKVGEDIAKPTMVYLNAGGGSLVHFNTENDIDDSTYELLYKWLIGSGGGSPEPYEDGSMEDGEQVGGTDIDPQVNYGTQKEDDFQTPKFDDIHLGFYTAYRVTEQNLTNIAATLWNPGFWDRLKDQYRQPAEAIISLHLLPFGQQLGWEYDPDHPNDPGVPTNWYENDAENIVIGYTKFTGEAKGQKVRTRWAKLPFGSVKIGSKYDTYLDYKGYKRISVYLPFIGEEELDVNELMCQTDADCNLKKKRGCELGLTYWVDILTGCCVAHITVNGEIRYQFTGQCAAEIPYSWATRQSIVSQIPSILGSVAGVVGGVALAPVTGGASLALGIGAGAVAGAKIGTDAALGGLRQPHGNGNFTPLAGAMMDTYPKVHIVYKNAVQRNKEIRAFLGNRAPVKSTVGAYTGFASFLAVHLKSLPATEAEKDEILSILREGVIV